MRTGLSAGTGEGALPLVLAVVLLSRLSAS